jgi:hypothetical protein
MTWNLPMQEEKTLKEGMEEKQVLLVLRMDHLVLQQEIKIMGFER